MKNKNILKGAGVLLIIVVLSSTLVVTAISEEKENSTNNSFLYGIHVDQKQEYSSNVGLRIYKDGCFYAQAFKPSMRTHVGISLKMFRNGNPLDYNLYLSIREELDSEDIATSILSEIVSNFRWYYFEFEPFDLTPGQIYYMVLRGDGGSENNKYCWGCYRGDDDKYPFGEAWDNSLDGEWTITYITGHEYFDFCFRTYILNNPPDTPIITGLSTGEAGKEYEYTFSITDLDGNKVYYYVDWGDGNYTDWFGPFDSGMEISKTHIWEDQDTYIIKARAKDKFHEYSEWATLEVSMQKNKPYINRPFQDFLEKHPLLQRLLQRFLQI
jgi:hypothetical protein